MSNPDELHPEHRLIAERRRKLHELRQSGFRFPNAFRPQCLADELLSLYGSCDGEALGAQAVEVSVAGRIMAKRVMGKTTFLKLQDRSGKIQIFLQQQQLTAPLYDAALDFDLGDIIGVHGSLFRTRTGELTVKADHLVLLTKSLRPLPDKFHGLTDQETRYRQRYLDLIVNETSKGVFKKRAQLVRYLRTYLDSLGFVEVETPMMQTVPGGATARPFTTHHNALDRDLYLRVAPELYLKRLVVGGFERVYEINRSFRNEGVSTQHNPEFTMLEMYMAYADHVHLMELLEDMLCALATELDGAQRIVYQGASYDLKGPFRRASIEELVVQCNPDMDPARLRDLDYLRAQCERFAIPVSQQHGPGKLLTEIFEKTAQAELQGPIYVLGFPAEVSPLARRNDQDPWLVDRFELYVSGREIANGFSELNDAEDQAERFRAQVRQKSAGDEEAMFYDADYVTALEFGMPPTAGLGIGIDRLVMLLTDMPSIRDVLLFPHLRDSASAPRIERG